jgi:flagella synthesis protein FlgN
MADLAEAAFEPVVGIVSECDATRDFIDLLQREQRTLQQADVSALVALTNEKTHRMQQLAQMADARNRWLATLDHTGDRSGMERILSDYPAATSVWKDLLKLAEMAAELNKINGILIDQRLRYNEQALAVLQAATPRNSGLYGSDGQPRPLCGGRQLGEG